MLTLKDLENIVDGDDSLEKLKKKVEAVTDDEMLWKLTERVLVGFIHRLAIEPKGSSLCHGTGTHSSFQEQNEDCLTRKQTKQTTENNVVKKQKRKITSNDNEKNHNQKKRMRKGPIVELIALGLEPPPDMPQEFKNRINSLGGTEIKLVIQKFIQVSDLKRQQNRLSMPLNQVRSKFLSEAEEQKLENKETIDAIFVEPCLKVSEVKFYWWRIGSSNAYIFNDKWKDVVRNNGDSLKPMAVVQVWSFRVQQPKPKLGFALIKVRDGEDGHVIN
ncbi:hypothetical protein PTKIN_Ptkin06aG0146100 [Pterospermum kingtungense]